MKALFIVFHGFEEANGISKKIQYQIKALKECGIDARTCYYDVEKDGSCKWKIDDKVLINLGKTIFSRIKKRFYYSPIFKYANNEKIDLVYIRSLHNANPFTIHLVKKLKEGGAKVVMEIPTYPYDQEYATPKMKLNLAIDRCFRNRMAKKLDAIVTFSNQKTIFGQKTIRISNGIDFSAIKMKEHINDTSSSLHLIGVAEIHYWHGYDRIVQGLVKYYKSESSDYKVYLHIVGNFSGKREEEEIMTPIRENHLEKYVIFHGAKHGKELDELFELSDVGIGSLGRHRSGITHIRTLKNREYAVRGIPFIYSESDSDFDNRPYILKEPADESPINIEDIIKFYHNQKLTPNEIRNSVKNLSWKNQMQKVIDSIINNDFN